MLANPVAEALEHVLKMIDDVNARIDAFHPRPTGATAEVDEQLERDMEEEQKKLERFLGGGGI